MKKTFLEIFHKYHPDTYTEKLLLTITDIKLMADKELKIIEITAHFPQIVEKSELYRIQEEIRKAYDILVDEDSKNAFSSIDIAKNLVKYLIFKIARLTPKSKAP